MMAKDEENSLTEESVMEKKLKNKTHNNKHKVALIAAITRLLFRVQCCLCLAVGSLQCEYGRGSVIRVVDSNISSSLLSEETLFYLVSASTERIKKLILLYKYKIK